MKWLGVVLLLFASAVWGQTTSPTNVQLPALNVSQTAVWQACGGGLFSDTTISIDDLLAQCTGRILFGCYALNSTTGFDPALLYGAVASDHATFQFGGTFNDTNTGLPVYVLNTATYIYGGNSSSISTCNVTTDGTCLDVDGANLGTSGFCPGMGYISNSTLIGRVFYSDPCSGLTPGANCSGVFGLCGSGAKCDANYFCTNSTNAQINNSSCTVYNCKPSTGQFIATLLPDGTLCPNENFCTSTSQCLAGTCVEQTPYTCQSPDICMPSTGCNYTSQACEYGPAPNGTLCSAANGCFQNSYCDGNGTCPTPSEYPPPTTNGGCMIGTSCNNVTGQWTYGPGVEGAPCDSGDPCYEYSACTVSGFGGMLVCSPLIYKNCTPPTDCYFNVGCYNGGCTYAQKPTGSACNPNDPCISNPVCIASGSCVGTPTVTCPSNPPPCQVYVREATSPTTCGCVLHTVADGGSCTAGSGECITVGTCSSGNCSTTTPRQCPGDDCNAPTVCNPVTGCTNAINDGGPCNTVCLTDGTCYRGTCTLGVLNKTNPVCNLFSAARRLATVLDYLL